MRETGDNLMHHDGFICATGGNKRYKPLTDLKPAVPPCWFSLSAERGREGGER